MTVPVLWSIVEVAYGCAALGAGAVAWAVWRRAEPGNDARLLTLSVTLLALHYVAFALDAHAHATGILTMHFTPWAAVGQTLATLSWSALTLFLLLVVRQLYTPARPARWLVLSVAVPATAASGVAMYLLASLARHLSSDAPLDVLAHDITRIIPGVVGMPTVLFFAVPCGAFGALFDRLPPLTQSTWRREDDSGAPWRLAHETPSRAGAAVYRSSASRQLVRVLSGTYLVSAMLIGVPSLTAVSIWTPGSIVVLTAVRLLVLPCLLGLLYFQHRYLFFDVVLKRGCVYAVIAAFVVGVAAGIGPLVEQFGGLSVVPAVSLLALVALGVSVTVIAALDRYLDRLLFQRPHYATALPAVADALADASDPAALTTSVTTHAEALFGADVVYGVAPTDDSVLSVRVGTPDRVRGYLSFGPRRRGQPYHSEDLAAIEAIAARFTGLLDAFEAREARHLATAAELRALRAQINPHFLFNALNTAAEMARSEPAAERTILNLARVFWHTLEATRTETVALGREVDAVRAYLEIEAERLSDRLRFEIDVPVSLQAVRVPPMLVQPLVENAVKHGVAPKGDVGTVRVGACRQNGQVTVTVADDGVGCDWERIRPNVGLANVRARVERSGGTWHAASVPGHGTLITMVMPCAS